MLAQPEFAIETLRAQVTRVADLMQGAVRRQCGRVEERFATVGTVVRAHRGVRVLVTTELGGQREALVAVATEVLRELIVCELHVLVETVFVGEQALADQADLWASVCAVELLMEGVATMRAQLQLALATGVVNGWDSDGFGFGFSRWFDGACADVFAKFDQRFSNQVARLACQKTADSEIGKLKL